MTLNLPQCLSCRHFIETQDTPAGEELPRMRCRAFSRIPADIVKNNHDHREPFPGDNGIRFELLGGSD